MLPTGGPPELAVAFGAVWSTNRIGILISMGTSTLLVVCQHKSMTEIAEMIESNLLTFEALAKYQSWMHREHWIYRTFCLYTMSRAKPKKLPFAKAAGSGAPVSSCVQDVSEHHEYK